MARKAKRDPRRKPGTGTIRHKKGRAEPWEAEWTHDDGRHEYRGFQWRAAAAAWLDELTAKRARGQDTTAGGKTFKTFFLEWLAIKATKIGAKTAHTYKFYGEVASGEGQIENIRIDTLTLEHMERLLTNLMRAKFQNVHELFGVLGQAFAYARRPSLRWMTVDPLDGLELPHIERRQNQVLTEAHRAHLLDVARDEHDPTVPLLPLWHLYARFGLRKGEGIALEWRDVDWERKTLTVDESVTNVGADNPRGKTKTRRTRVIPLSDDMIDLLRAHQAAQRQRGIFPSIFVDAIGETVTPQHVQYRWSLLRKRAGCPKTTLHDLRHTCLYLLALQGVPDNIRMALAGHSTTDMATLYAHHASVEDVRKFVG